MNIRLFISFIFTLCAVISAQASSNLYYGALRAESAPAAGGRVYAGVTNRTDTLAQAMTSANQSTETMDGEVVFYAYAQASSGWSFAGWSSAPDGAVTRTENPLAVSVACRAKNENVPTTDTVYALFRELQAAMITLEAPTLIDGTAGGGSYTAQFSDGTSLELSAVSGQRSHSTSGTVTLTAHADADYKFFGWKKLTTTESTESTENTEYISYEDTLRNYGFAEDCTIRAIFVPADIPLWEIKGQFGRYASLGEAVSIANTDYTNDTKVIALVSSGTLHGSYEIPEGVTMLIPFDKQLSCYRSSTLTERSDSCHWAPNYEYIRLTMASDACLTIRGELSLSAKMRSSEHGMGSAGNVNGPYSRMHLEQGAQILLQDSAKLYCWGFITGKGEVQAADRSTVYEGFHIPRFRGGSVTSSIAGSKLHVFPLNQYYIHNVEAPLTLVHTASLRVFTSVCMDEKIFNAGAPYIGAEGLFRPQDGTVIRKHYDPARDRQIYDISGSTDMASLNLMMAGYEVNSEVFVLPITNNMDIRVRNGETTVEHQLALLAGASITIDEGATLRLKDSTFIYDKDEWLRDEFDFGGYITTTVNSPDVTFVRDTANLTDAKLDVNGTLLVDSAFYTTKGGANICSSQGTGRIVFNHVSPAADTTWQVVQHGLDFYFKYIPCTAPKLRNAERYAGAAAEYLSTIGADGAPGISRGDTIFAHNGHWGWIRSWEDENHDSVYACFNALTEAELTDSIALFTPEKYNSLGEPCLFLGWTDAERDEANQQITVWAQWECPEEPVDAIEETEIGGNKEQETRNKKILRDGEIIIITPYHEYNILGVVVK